MKVRVTRIPAVNGASQLVAVWPVEDQDRALIQNAGYSGVQFGSEFQFRIGDTLEIPQSAIDKARHLDRTKNGVEYANLHLKFADTDKIAILSRLPPPLTATQVVITAEANEA